MSNHLIPRSTARAVRAPLRLQLQRGDKPLAWLLVLLSVLALSATSPAAAQTTPVVSGPFVPTRNITFVCQSSVGSAPDTFLRGMASYMNSPSVHDSLLPAGVYVGVSNIVGDGGRLSVRVAQRNVTQYQATGGVIPYAAAESHTLTLVHVPNLYLMPPFDPTIHADQLRTVYVHSYSPSMFVVTPNSPYQTLFDLFAAADLAAATPGAAPVSIGAPIWSGHWLMIQDLRNNGFGKNLQLVSYNDGVTALRLMTQGNITCLMLVFASGINTPPSTPIRAIAVSSQLRAPEYPDVPTLFELGLLPPTAYQPGMSTS